MTFEVPADAYGRFMGRYSEPLAVELADSRRVTSRPAALDVGCGPGALTAVLVERLGRDHVAALDPSPPFVEAARTRLPGVDIRLASAESIPFDDDSFDVALAELVVHFMSDPVAGIAEMARVTKPGGTIAACVWDHAATPAPLSPFWKVARSLDPDCRRRVRPRGLARGAARRDLRGGGSARHPITTLTVRGRLHGLRGVVGAVHARRRTGRRLRRGPR